jgi:hypothetical protein
VADAPHWDEQPIALRDGPRLRAVTAAAARTQVRAGMTITAARGRCAGLEVRAWDDAIRRMIGIVRHLRAIVCHLLSAVCRLPCARPRRHARIGNRHEIGRAHV